MSGLMSRGASQVEVGQGTSREGRKGNDDPIIPGVARVVGREGSVTEETRGFNINETDGVDVECTGASPTESGLHGVLLGSSGASIFVPVGFLRLADFQQIETEASIDIVRIQDIDLILDLGSSET